ncbi:MAG: hypothetical protein AAGN82_28835 [Myxococcota bacterium]
MSSSSVLSQGATTATGPPRALAVRRAAKKKRRAREAKMTLKAEGW